MQQADTIPVWARIAESLLLLAGLFCTLPYIPSNDVERLPTIFPVGIFLFLLARLIRWRGVVLPLLETLAFAVIAWGAHEAANLLYWM